MARKRNRARPEATARRADAYISADDAPATLSPVFDPRRGWGLETLTTLFRRSRALGAEEILGLYGDGIGRRIAELPVTMALSQWPRLYVGEAWRDAADRVEARARALDAPKWITRAHVWAYRDGWSLSITGWAPHVADPAIGSFSAPAPYGAGRVLWVRPAYRWDCSLASDYYGPDSPHYGQVKYVTVNRMRSDVEDDTRGIPGLGPVHGSRFMRVSTETGRSVYSEVAQYLVQILNGGGGVANALARSVIGVFSVKGWKRSAYKSDSEAYQLLKSQFDALSAQAPLAIDSDDAFDLKSNSALGGSESSLYALAWLLSAAAGIPMSILYGIEPGGFSAGGVTERAWMDRLEAERRRIEPTIRHLYDALWTEETGSAAVPEYTLEWPPVRRLLPEEQAKLVTDLTAAATAAVTLGITTPAQVAEGLASMAEVDVWTWEQPALVVAETPEGAVPEVGAPSETVAETALTGVQIQSLLEVAAKVGTGEIGREEALGILRISFPQIRPALLETALPDGPAAPPAAAPTPAGVEAAPEMADAPEDPVGPEVEPPPPPAPPPGTYLEAREASERSGISASKIASMGRRGVVHRRKLPGTARWEFRLEDLLEVAAGAVEGPSVAAEEPDPDSGPRADESTEEYIARAYKRFHEVVNMSASEIQEWASGECSKKASVSRDPIERNVRLLSTPREKWTRATAQSAMRTVSFVERMLGAENGEEVCEGLSKREISLRNWGHRGG